MATVTLTITSPCVVDWGGAAPVAGTEVIFTTTGALPTGIVATTSYYVKSPSGNTSNLAATSALGAAINTSGTQSGTHTGTALLGVLAPPVMMNVDGIVLGDQRVTLSNVPLAATCTVSGLATGSRVRVSRQDTGAEIALGSESGGLFIFSTKEKGGVYIDVRKSSGAPKYLPKRDAGNIGDGGMNIVVQQVLDTVA